MKFKVGQLVKSMHHNSRTMPGIKLYNQTPSPASIFNNEDQYSGSLEPQDVAIVLQVFGNDERDLLITGPNGTGWIPSAFVLCVV